MSRSEYKNTAESILARVAMGDEDECWLWTGSRTVIRGVPMYGQVSYQGKQVGVHRFVYEHLVGPIPDGLQIDHLCRVYHCCNPSHLEPVTHGENIRRGTAGDWQKAKTHCPNGHVYDEENTYLYKDRFRLCRPCHRERGRASYARRKQAVTA